MMEAAQPLAAPIDHKGVIMSEHAVELTRVEFGTFRKPEQVVDEAAHVARVFQHKMDTILDKANQPILYRMFGPSRHITRPGWQLLGSMFRVTAGIVPATLRFVEYGGAEGFECTAEAIYVPTGARISTAVGLCLTDEDNWDTRPEYKYNEATRKREKTGEELRVPLHQLGSMCQTRACSKVLSNLLSYVAIMAGCSGTAAEEMTGEPIMNGQSQTAAQQPQRTQNGNGVASEKQIGRLWAIAKSVNKSDEAVGVILEAFGYSTKDGVRPAADHIKREHYDQIVEQVNRP